MAKNDQGPSNLYGKYFENKFESSFWCLYFTTKNKSDTPSGFECTFEDGICGFWELFPRNEVKDPRTNMTKIYNAWMVIQGPSISLLTGPKHDHTRKVCIILWNFLHEN